MGNFKSDISGKEFADSEKVTADGLRKALVAFIQKQYPDFKGDKCLARSELTSIREQYIAQLLVDEKGQLSELENTVLNSLKNDTILTDKLDDDRDDSFTLGQRVADKVASFGGSWTFIISFGCFLLVWIAANAFILGHRTFDPYPFILLNLILSCLAALQAPVIMMSQNRQEEKDRERAKNDYMINLKSELEIRILHEKVDHLILHQQQQLMEIQRLQIDMLNDIMDRVEKK